MLLSSIFARGSVVVVVVAISFAASPDVDSASVLEVEEFVASDAALPGDVQPVTVGIRRREMTTLARTMAGEGLRIIGGV
jgi:hypothetical protein